MRIFLVGYMGCGKSTLGRSLAKRLDFLYLDLDEYFETKYKTSIALFFERFGEDSFRRLEHQALIEAISDDENMVIATGGGTACYYDNIKLMNQHGFTVFLKLPAAVLASRLNNSPFRYKRPKLKGLDKSALFETVKAHLAEREIFYSQSKLTVEVFNQNTEKIVNIIVNAMNLKPGETMSLD